MRHSTHQPLLWCVLLCASLWFITASQAEESPAVSKPPAPLTHSNEELLTQMLVVDVSERTLDAVPALAITFSQDLDPKTDFNAFITLTESGKAVDGSWVLASEPRRLYFSNIKPQTEYRIQVRPGVSSSAGLYSFKPADATVKTRDVEPAFDFATQGSVLPTKLTNGLPIRVVNVPEVDIEFLRVQPDKLPQLLKGISLGQRLSQWQLEEVHNVTESVHSSRYVTDAKPNARTSAVVPVESIPELQQPGLYFAVMHQPGRFNDDSYRITQFVVTNIGLHVRLYPRGLEVFANALDTGKPMRGMKLKLQGEKETLELETDEQGHASFVHRPAGDLLLVAMQDSQFAFLDLRDAALDLSEYKVTGAQDQPISPFIYSTRDLFRPGEVMDLSVLLRNRDGETVSVNKLNLRIVRPDGKTLLEENLTAANADLGYFAYRFAIPNDAPTGTWTAEVRNTAKDESPIASFEFHVQEFMPERMKLGLKTDTQRLMNGEKWVVGVQGDYLYGSPASGNRLTARRSVALNRHPFDTLKDFYFGNPLDEKLNSSDDLPETTLNDQGGVFLDVPALSGKIHSPLTVSVEGNLHEVGGRTVTRQLAVPFWPAAYVVGIRPTFAKDTVDANTNAEFELARVNVEGQAATTTQAMAVTLVREEREYFWKYNSAEGWQREDLASEYPVTLQKVSLDAQGHAKVAFPVQHGYYRIEVEDSETGLKAVYPFHAGWDWEQAEKTAARPDQIELALDKPAYQGGEMAKLTVTPPAAGEAIVAVEGESMLWSKRVTLPEGASTIEIPIDKAWNRHDLYVTVTAFRPASAQQKIAPNRALGVIFLPLNRENRKLDIKITAPEKILPEQTINVTVSSDGLKGQAAIVTLAAVDNGVLNITDFKTPDPFAFYFAQHRYGVDLYDAYGKIIENIDGKALRQRFGGDGGFGSRGGAMPPANVRIVNLFSGPVLFDETGKAEVELALPGFDGSLRLMAVAASRERLGSAEREMKVASPVVASLSAPRFLANGDKSFVTVDLNNTTATTQVVNLKLNASPLLDFTPVAKDITLEKGKHEVLRLPLAANQTLGNAQVDLTLTGKDFTANRQLILRIRPAYPARHAAVNKVLADGESFTLDAAAMKGFLPDGLGANLSISTTPSLPLRSVLDGLLQYPYGCLEQTTSSAWPYLYLEPTVIERLGLQPLTIQERNKRVQSAIMHLAGMQLSNGGFALWDDSSSEEFWLTPYVTDFLLDAKDQGFVVPDWLLQRALKNLQERLQEQERYIESRYESMDNPAHADLAARAYASYVLSRVKQVSLSTLRGIYDQDADKAASGLPLIHLGLALRSLGDSAPQGTSPRWQQAIDKGLSLVRDQDAYLGDYGSGLRDDAAMLYLLLRNKVTIPAYAARVNKLADHLHNKQWLSTQEQIFTLFAGLQVQEKDSSSWKAALSVGGSPLDLAGSYGHNRDLSVADLQKGVKITSHNAEPLYVSLTLDGYPSERPAVDSDPISVQRQWFDMKGKKIDMSTPLKAGDLLLVHLDVQSSVSINDAIVVDFLPAGLEIEHTELSDLDSFETLQVDGLEKPVAELLNDLSVNYEVFRDDRYVAALPLEAKSHQHLFYLVRVVSSGSFIVPPPVVEDMYRPDLNGIGAGSNLVVP